MGARRITQWAVLAAACVLPARVTGSVIVDPVARLSLEGGYDSNVAFDGNGGGSMARVSPDVGLEARDHTWLARGTYGADLFHYPSRADEQVVNQRGMLHFEGRPGPRSSYELDGLFHYAPDPIGLARLGFVVRTGDAVLWRGDARVDYRVTRRFTVAATFRERAARLDGVGVAMHAPGAEASWRFDARTELGAAYRFDTFQSLGGDLGDGHAHEGLAFARWRWSRRLRLEVEGGPAIWNGRGGQAVIPVAAVTLLASDRLGDLRLQARHGLGINALARGSIFDAVEAGFGWRISRSFMLRGDGGLWNGGLLPDGDGATTGYGLSAELAWLARRGLEVGFGGSRYARLDDTSATFQRNQLGIRVTWQLVNH